MKPTRVKNAVWLRVSGEQELSFFSKPDLDLTPTLVCHIDKGGSTTTLAYYRLTHDGTWKMQEEVMRTLCVIFMGDPTVIKKKFRHPRAALDALAQMAQSD